MDKDIEIIAENRCFPIANAEMKASRRKKNQKMCPDCAKRGIESRIRLCQINYEEACYICPNEECPFPLFSDPSTLIIQRNYMAAYSKPRHRKAANRPPQTTVTSDCDPDMDWLLNSCCETAAASGEILNGDVADLAALLDGLASGCGSVDTPHEVVPQTDVESQLDLLDNSSWFPANERISAIPPTSTPVAVMPQTDVTLHLASSSRFSKDCSSVVPPPVVPVVVMPQTNITPHLAYPSQFPVKDRVSAVTYGAVVAQIKVNPDLASSARLSAENLKPPAVQEAKNTTTKRKRQSPACGRRRNPPVKTVKAAVTSLPQPQETKVEVSGTCPDIFSIFETQTSIPTAKKPRRPPVKRGPRVVAVSRPTETALSKVNHWLQNRQTTTKHFPGYQPKYRQRKDVDVPAGCLSDDSGIQSTLSGKSEGSSGSRPPR